MERERWHLVEDIYHSALERNPDERDSYLRDACKGDEALRRELASLLASDSKARNFIESPALQVAAQLLTKQEIEDHGPKALSAGTTISHYRIIEKIGAGGMGEVYRAHDPRLARDVAIKILPQAFSTVPDRLRRFEQEARAAAALNHPNIVSIYDVGTWEYGTPYVVSELLHGETLRACIQRGPLSVRKTTDISSQICLGLASAHEKGIVHRDLKPENIWLTHDGHVKILDFGLAKLLPDKVNTSEVPMATQTASTRIMGTVGYMSPEQVRGQLVDPRSDIFSLGAVMYEMLAGNRAFQGATPADTISAILNRDPAELTINNNDIPPAVSGIVRRALEKSANDRFQSAKDLAFALTAAAGTGRASTPASDHPLSSLKFALAAAILIVTLAVVWLWNPRDIRSKLFSPSTASVRSLAVLPLENVSGSPDQEYFADGMTDELITQLASLNNVRVISRSSVMRFRSSKQSLPEIAGMLHVDAIVEGSVLRQGDRVRITAQLVQAADERHLWAHSYEGGVSDVIRLQNEVAGSVTESIKAALLPEAQERLSAPHRPVPPDAYDAYLKGLYFSARLTPADMRKSFDYFQKAIAADPTFAPAYGGMAEAYSWSAGVGFMTAQESLPQAEAAANKALQIDPNLAMAHHALAWVKYALKWDFPAAEKEFQRAIDLSPNDVTGHLWYGMFLAWQNRTPESLAEMQRAKQLDPFSSIVNGLAMTPLLTSRQYDRLIDSASESLQSNPNDPLLMWLLATAYEQKRDFAKAIDEQEKQAIFFGEDRQKANQEFNALRRDLAEHGERGYWLNKEKSAAQGDPFGLAVVQAHLGEWQNAYATLEKAYTLRSRDLLHSIQTEPAFDPYRSEQNFQDLVHRMGFKQ